MHRQHRSRTWESQYRRRTTPNGLSEEPVASNSSRRQGAHRTRPSRLGTTSSELQRQQQASSQSAAASLASLAILHLNGLFPSLQPSAGRAWAMRSAGRENAGGGGRKQRIQDATRPTFRVEAPSRARGLPYIQKALGKSVWITWGRITDLRAAPLLVPPLALGCPREP